MLFLTYWFVLFAAAFFILYWCIPNTEVRVGLVLVSCVVFHTHFAGPAGVAPVLVLGVVTYFAARSQNKKACLASILLCVLALIFYKYSNFILTGMVAPIAPGLAKVLEGWAKHVLPAAPPLAISFFVFEFVHYLYDVRKGSAPFEESGRVWGFRSLLADHRGGPHQALRGFCTGDVRRRAHRMPA